MNKKVFVCSFCKRLQTEVKKLIVGPNVYICDFCTNICAEILHEDDKIENKSNSVSIPLQLTPEEIFNKLNEVVAGQSEAKKELSIAAYLHYLRMNEDLEHKNNNITKLKKYNILMIGPTGSGKTLLMETLSKILNVAHIIIDANTLTETGYVGEDVEGIVTKLFNSVYNGNNLEEAIRKTKYGFIFIDEIDKKYSADSTLSNRDVSGKGVQQNLLKLIEGTDVQINNKKNPHQEPIIINTSSIFIIGGGAFQGLDKIIKQSIKHTSPLGFNFNKNNIHGIISNNIPDNEIMKYFKKEHLVTYGMIPELIGRFECITILYALNENQLVEILKDKKDNLMEEYKRIFILHNVELKYDEDILYAIAKKALKENVGARGLRSIVHELFSDVIFTMPTICKDKENTKYVLNIKPEYVENNTHLKIEIINKIYDNVIFDSDIRNNNMINVE